MKNIRTVVAVVLLALAAASSAAASDTKFKSREYKLGLESNGFEGRDVAVVVSDFWKTVLKPTIAKELDDGVDRASGKFEAPQERTTIFRDTQSCVLKKNGFSLRERTEDGKRELTLKFRSSDQSAAADMKIEPPADAEKFKTKLEEDITTDAGGEGDSQPGMRSIFSQSATQRLKANAKLDQLGDALDRYPTLASDLKGNRAAALGATEALNRGPTIRELVFEGAAVDLGEGVDAEFSLTIWYDIASAAPKLMLAEISFKYDLADGKVPEAAADRAKKLFLGMQKDMSPWVDREAGTKTSVGIPENCRVQ